MGETLSLRRSLVWKSVAVGVVLTSVAAACGGDNKSSTNTTAAGGGTTAAGAASTAAAGKPVPGGSLSVGLEAENNTGWYMPDAQCPVSCAYVTNNLFDPLMKVDSTGKPAPWLALSATPNADATVWTIKLRQGVKFHNGEPFDATAVKMNIDAGKAGSVLALALAPVKETKVIDPYTVEIDMNSPWGALPESPQRQGFMMAAPAQITAKDKNHPIGTGPFMFKEWVPNDHLTVEKNPNYWYKDPKTGDQLPYLDEVIFKPIPEISAREAALKSGQIDVMHTSNGNEIAKLQADKSFQMSYRQTPSETGLLPDQPARPGAGRRAGAPGPRLLHRPRRGEQGAQRRHRTGGQRSVPAGQPRLPRRQRLPGGP